ncbi:MAG: molybdopterin-dependent oxidoreductase [Alphaproteobacteria bacterium]|nr:molybdopterin-dependent oxidoreductase [Alphaproteobacteria bacterium]
MALAVTFLALGPLGPALAAEAVLLTIAGDITNTNRGKFDPFQDGFLAYHEKSFERAFQLTRNDLIHLPQSEITALGSADTWHGPATLKGPRLKDVLARAGAGAKPVTIFALDGYGAAFDTKLLDSREWILAHTMNGQPLGIGGRGPLWLAYETGAKPASAEEEAKWVWSVFYIEVGNK